MIVTSSVAFRISSSLWLTSATARPSSATTWRSVSKSCSLSAGREDRRRLVEDQDRRVATKALDDLDPLPHPDRQLPDHRVGVDVEAVAVGDLDDAITNVDRTERACLAERDVLPDAERLDQAEVLVHHADAVACGIEWVAEADPVAVDRDRAGVGDHQADHDLHQR